MTGLVNMLFGMHIGLVKVANDTPLLLDAQSWFSHNTTSDGIIVVPLKPGTELFHSVPHWVWVCLDIVLDILSFVPFFPSYLRETASSRQRGIETWKSSF